MSLALESCIVVMHPKAPKHSAPLLLLPNARDPPGVLGNQLLESGGSSGMGCLIESFSGFIHKCTLEMGLWVSNPLTRGK